MVRVAGRWRPASGSQDSVGLEHEGYFPGDSEAIDFFAPVREDFLTGEPPPYMTGGKQP